jgi:hypothetical protein
MVYGRVTIDNTEQQSLGKSILYMGQSVLGLVISFDVRIIGCDHRLGTFRPHLIPYYHQFEMI